MQASLVLSAEAIPGASELADQGVLGIMLMIALAVIGWLARREATRADAADAKVEEWHKVQAEKVIPALVRTTDVLERVLPVLERIDTDVLEELIDELRRERSP